MGDFIHVGDRVRYRQIAFSRQIPGTVTWVAERLMSFLGVSEAGDYAHDVLVDWGGNGVTSREWSGNLTKVVAQEVRGAKGSL